MRANVKPVIAQLVESDLPARQAEHGRFLALADRLMSSRDPAEQVEIKEKLARLTFGS